MCVQLLAPCATTLEGTLLGSQAFMWVGGRTVVSAVAAVTVLLTTSRLQWGLTGIWTGLVTLVAVNCLLDAYRILSPKSPLALTQKSPQSEKDDWDGKQSQNGIGKVPVERESLLGGRK